MDLCDLQANGDENERADGAPSTSTSSPYKLFGRQNSVHQMMGGGKGNCHSRLTSFGFFF